MSYYKHLSFDGEEGVHAGVLGGVEQLVLYAQQLVVLGHALGAGGSAGLDLACVHAHDQVCDSGVLGLA